MNILLIGGTGFIGSQVITQFGKTDHNLAVFHRGKTNKHIPNNIIQIKSDRTNISDFTDVLKQFAPAVVIDIIPYTKQQTAAALEVFKSIASRFIAISSCDVYRNYDGFRGKTNHKPDPTPLKESAPLRESKYPYRGVKELEFEHKQNYEKILVEKEVINKTELTGTVLRMPAIYGPGDKQHRFYPYV
jgi:nucleoside-diphosphate-sugar epimerase